MNQLIEVLCGSAGQHLALALLHSLWQASLAACFLTLALRLTDHRRPELRYWWGAVALASVVLSAVVTWSWLNVAEPTLAEAKPTRTAGHAAVTEIHPQSDPAPLFRGSRVLPAGQLTPLATGSPSHSAWAALIIVCWSVGVAVMFLRLIWTLISVRRLARGRQIIDERVQRVAQELRQRLGLRRPVRVLEAVSSFGPAVIGILRPVLVLPVSMLTGLPTDMLEAVVAHELAHVRRHDYLFNLLQMAIEVLLFFNPAVWWINRRIRIEREACCDALAVSVTGKPMVLARALADWAEASHTASFPAAALAWNGRGPRPLVDRVLRLLAPDYRPAVGVSPLGLAGLLLAGALLGSGLLTGTSAVVAMAAEALSPAERTEELTKTQKEYAPLADDTGNQEVIVSGTIRTFDGKPLTAPIYSQTFFQSEHASGASSNDFFNPGTFSLKAHAGRISLIFIPKDEYAPAVVGPLVAGSGQKIEHVDVVLGKGFPLTVRVVDDKGEPVVGVPLEGSPELVGGSLRLNLGTTDEKGLLIIKHAIESQYVLSAQKPGFQSIEARRFTVKAKDELKITLRHARPLRGVAFSTEDRKPVSGATVRQFARLVPGSSNMDGRHGPVLATTDAEGRFLLDQLSDNTTYALLLTAPDHRMQLVQGLSTTQDEIRVPFGPKLKIVGAIKGNVEKLPKENGKPYVTFGQCVNIDGGGSSCGGGKATVAAVVGGGRFEIEEILPQEVTITADDHNVKTTVDFAIPVKTVSIDLTQPAVELAKRSVVLQFVTPDGGSVSRGTIWCNAMKDGLNSNQNIVAIKEGQATFEAFAGGHLSYRPENLLSYWFEDKELDVPPGADPFRIPVPVVPAGALVGHVFNADGTPAVDRCNVSLRVVDNPMKYRLGGPGKSTDEKGKYFVNSLPLGGSYSVNVACGHNVAVAHDVVRLDATQPVGTIDVRLPKTAAVSGTIVDSRGKALGNAPFTLEYSAPDCGWSFGGSRTDSEGNFQLDDLSVEGGNYAIRLVSTTGQPLAAPVQVEPGSKERVVIVDVSR